MPTTTLDLEIGEALIRRFEGCSLSPIPDTGTRWQIGFGLNFLPDGSPVTQTTPGISPEVADQWLALVLARLAHEIAGLAPAGATPCQLGAIYSFAWNEGEGHLAGSNLLRYWRAGQLSAALSQFPSWVYVGGRVSRGLQIRRAVEAQVFQGLLALGEIPTWSPRL